MCGDFSLYDPVCTSFQPELLTTSFLWWFFWFGFCFFAPIPRLPSACLFWISSLHALSISLISEYFCPLIAFCRTCLRKELKNHTTSFSIFWHCLNFELLCWLQEDASVKLISKFGSMPTICKVYLIASKYQYVFSFSIYPKMFNFLQILSWEGGKKVNQFTEAKGNVFIK